MPYTAERPPTPSPEELRARVPGWGADLDPGDRPSVPRERFAPEETGAWWDLPEQQPGGEDRERSVEHLRLPPVFGTSVPMKGVSGALRRLAYDRWSEGRAAHWLVLLAADRVDAYGSQLRSLASSRPVPPWGTGLASERSHGGIRSRTGTGRVDTHHQWMDPLVVAGPFLALGAGAVWAWRRARPSS